MKLSSKLKKERTCFPPLIFLLFWSLRAFPIICLSQKIVLVCTSLTFVDLVKGDDTALNNVLEAVDKIKESAVSTNRVFVVEVMGSTGYLVTY